MNNIEVLEKQKVKVLESIKKIEKLKGIENEDNLAEISRLNSQKAKVNSQINDLSAKLSNLKLELDGINQEKNLILNSTKYCICNSIIILINKLRVGGIKNGKST
ncbi:hypothetical protein [Intestinibacter sp.]|uniref:hypothetical protein n=1 Tax=Intestinibacter sp. TaxID=1965304 RepID=UPI002A91D4A1|nr:hypothetical protein [Intestinibacter sp.]MDY5213144.1 hypothetical protein [Intestinibacter sp.]